MSDADRPSPQSPTVFEGTFIDTAAAAADELRVIIPAFDDGENFSTVVWAPRVNDAGAAIYPSDGDWCALTETADGSWLVLLWTPS